MEVLTVGTCPFSRLPCMGQACSLWGTSKVSGTEGCGFGLLLQLLCRIENQVAFVAELLQLK